MNLSSVSRWSSRKMRTRKVFNFLVMWIEIDVFIRKFIKRDKISVHNRNFKKWIEIWVNIWKFTKWIKIGMNTGSFTQSGLKSMWILEILQSGLKSFWIFEILQSQLNHSHKKGKDRREPRAVYIEISWVFWNLPNGPIHQDQF